MESSVQAKDVWKGEDQIFQSQIARLRKILQYLILFNIEVMMGITLISDTGVFKYYIRGGKVGGWP